MANQEITDDVRAHSSDKRHLRPQALDSNRLIGALAAREEFQIRGQYVLSFARRPFGVDHHIEVAAADYDDSNIFHRLQNGLLSAANHNYTEFAPESISAVLTSNRDSQSGKDGCIPRTAGVYIRNLFGVFSADRGSTERNGCD